MARAKRLISWLITYIRLGERPNHRRVAYNARITGDVLVGDYSYIGGRTEIRAVLSRITIGRYCSIGRDVKIFSAGQMHRFDGISTYPFYVIDKEIERRHYNVGTDATQIGNDVWIGSNAVIQAGVTVGDGAVIGASAVVTRDVEPYSVVAGVPARVIGSRFDEAAAAQVAKSSWWLLDYPELKARMAGHIVHNRPVREADEL